MKFLAPILAFAALALASPNLVKRADVHDVATLGYATQNGGTTGGSGGPITNVNSLSALQAALNNDNKKVVILTASLTGSARVKVGSNTSLIGNKGVTLTGIGLDIGLKKNVIVRNLRINKVIASNGDAIGITTSSNVWIDQVELWSDKDHGAGYYDGLLDITKGSNFVTVTNSYFHDHFKGLLAGASDDTPDIDKSMKVTYAYNYFKGLNSRGPLFRFGTAHLFNNVYDDNAAAINTRLGAQLLVENNVFGSTTKTPIEESGGFAVMRGNDFGGKNPSIPVGTFTKAPYTVSLTATSSVRSSVVGKAGATISLSTGGGTTPPPPPPSGCSAMFGQCGGSGWTGPTCCSAGTCKISNEWYSQCL